jgi:hypothetical protein
MSVENEHILFRKIELSDLERERAAAARSAVYNLPEVDVVFSARDAGVVENLLEKLRFEVPEVMENLEPRTFHQDVKVGDGYGGRVETRRKFAELLFPFTGDSRAFHVRPPSQHYGGVLRASIQPGFIRHVVSMDHKNTDQVATELDTFVRELKATRDVLRLDFKAATDRLRSKVTQLLNERRQGLAELKALGNELAAKMRNRA